MTSRSLVENTNLWTVASPVVMVVVVIVVIVVNSSSSPSKYYVAWYRAHSLTKINMLPTTNSNYHVAW